MTVGEMLFARRKALGLSQDAVAEAAGIGQTTISRYESGKTSPTADHLKLLAAALKCEPGDFFSTGDADTERGDAA
jgi:transcriptional regulator with XRE-family HTH domain